VRSAIEMVKYDTIQKNTMFTHCGAVAGKQRLVLRPSSAVRTNTLLGHLKTYLFVRTGVGNASE